MKPFIGNPREKTEDGVEPSRKQREIGKTKKQGEQRGVGVIQEEGC